MRLCDAINNLQLSQKHDFFADTVLQDQSSLDCSTIQLVVRVEETFSEQAMADAGKSAIAAFNRHFVASILRKSPIWHPPHNGLCQQS